MGAFDRCRQNCTANTVARNSKDSAQKTASTWHLYSALAPAQTPNTLSPIRHKGHKQNQCFGYFSNPKAIYRKVEKKIWIFCDVPTHCVNELFVFINILFVIAATGKVLAAHSSTFVHWNTRATIPAAQIECTQRKQKPLESEPRKVICQSHICYCYASIGCLIEYAIYSFYLLFCSIVHCLLCHLRKAKHDTLSFAIQIQYSICDPFDRDIIIYCCYFDNYIIDRTHETMTSFLIWLETEDRPRR